MVATVLFVSRSIFQMVLCACQTAACGCTHRHPDRVLTRCDLCWVAGNSDSLNNSRTVWVDVGNVASRGFCDPDCSLANRDVTWIHAVEAFQDPVRSRVEPIDGPAYPISGPDGVPVACNG
jgi:hypothetical protein